MFTLFQSLNIIDWSNQLSDAYCSRTCKMTTDTVLTQCNKTIHKQTTATDNTTHHTTSHDNTVSSTDVDIMLAKLAVNNGAGHSKKTTAGLWWTAALFIALNHIVVAISLYVYPIQHKRIWYATGIMAWLHLLGVTAGYHRLWSHRSYTAHWSLRVFLAITGLMSFQGSARWWALRHRLHHRFVDTALDPYNARRGLFYSHIGWLFEKPRIYQEFSIVNARDLDLDWVCVVQKQYLLYGYIIFGALYPTVLGYILCNDALGGLIYIGGLARILSWHSIFSVNSLSHWKGNKEYNRTNTAVSNHLIGVLQNGEGYHNFHHEFPGDYRSGVKYTDLDITKWCIYIWYLLGLVRDMRYASNNEIQKRVLDVQQDVLNEQREKVVYPPDDFNLKSMTIQQVRDELASDKNKLLIILNGYVLDITEFKQQNIHPGGNAYLQAFRGKDCTTAFTTSVNNHNKSSHNLAAMYRIGKLVEC